MTRAKTAVGAFLSKPMSQTCRSQRDDRQMASSDQALG